MGWMQMNYQYAAQAGVKKWAPKLIEDEGLNRNPAAVASRWQSMKRKYSKKRTELGETGYGVHNDPLAPGHMTLREKNPARLPVFR